MDKYLFSVLILSIIAFIDILITIKRPIFKKINYLFIISLIFIFNFIIYMNFSSGFLFIIIPFLNSLIGSNLIILFNLMLVDKVYKWVKINLSISIALSFLFSYILYTHREIYSFYNNEMISFYILPEFFYLKILRYSFKMIILITFIIIFYKLYHTTNSNNQYTDAIKKWGLRFIYLIFIITVNFGIFNLINHTLNGIELLKLNLVITSYFLLLNFIYKPSFFKFQTFNYNKLTAFNKTTSILINDRNFTTPFFTHHFYLNKDANLERFCKENDIEEKEDFHDLIIIKFKMSFNNLINKYRVLYFLDLVKSNKYKNYSIDALAQESGFNSRHHLYKPFKKFHGGTPSDFIYFAND